MIRSAIGQRAMGLALAVVGGWFTVSEWQTAIDEGFYHPKAAALFPCFTLLGLGMILFPIDCDRLMAVHGMDRPRYFRHYPMVWKVWIWMTIAASLGNWYAMAHWN